MAQQPPSSAPPAWTPPAVTPHRLDPDHFEDFEGFRETTLAWFTEPQANATLRGLGDLLYTMALEYCGHWPKEPEGVFRHQARAVVADLRHLEGWLGQLDRERTDSALTLEEERISATCGSLVPGLKAIGDTIEAQLGPAPTGEL